MGKGRMWRRGRFPSHEGSRWNRFSRSRTALGPAKVIHVHDPTIGLRGILVVDNVATGPSIGGRRMALDVSVQECFRLAPAPGTGP
jgi:hypothetical protein